MSIGKKPKPTPSPLEAWLSDPRLDEYLGRRAAFKMAVLARVVAGSGETLAAIGRRFGASRAAACHHARAARVTFGIVEG